MSKNLGLNVLSPFQTTGGRTGGRLLLGCLSLLLLPGCFSSSREQALRNEIQSLQLKITNVEKELLNRDKNINTAKSTSEDANRRAQVARNELEEIKRSVNMTQGAIDELRVKMSRMQEGAGGKEDASSVKLGEVEALMTQFEARLAKLELERSSQTKRVQDEKDSEKDKSSAKKPAKKSDVRYKSVAELTKALSNAYGAKDFKKVISIANETLDSEPEPSFEETALSYRAEAYFASQDYEKAALDFTSFVEKFPRSDRKPRALLLAGDSFVYLKQPRVAKVYYSECVKSFPNREECKASKERLDKLGV